MNNKTRLIKKYKPLIKSIGKKTVSEFKAILENEFSAVPIDFLSISEIMRKMMSINLSRYIEDRGIILPSKDFRFIAYRIENKGLGATYYKYRYTSMRISGKTSDSLYVILEEHIDNYMYCNCNKLFLDLTVLRGISEYDYNNDTLTLVEYLSRMEALKNNWY